MSSYKGNADTCPHGCGLTYRRLKTGLRYYDVFTLLMDYSTDRDEWKYKRRHTVLGKWHEIKQSQWKYHCEEGGCPNDPRNVAAEQSVVALGDAVVGFDDGVPF